MVQQESFVWTKAITLIGSKSLSDAAEYADAATAPAVARLIFLPGSCPLNEDGSTAGVGDVAAQSAENIENTHIALPEAGAGFNDVISTRVLVVISQQSDLVTAWVFVRDTFPDHDVPTAFVRVTVLGYDDQLVEIEAVAQFETD